jgi:hypothetical protein
MSGARNEHLKIILDNEPATALLRFAANRQAHAEVPREIARVLALKRLTDLVKPNRRIRRTSVGEPFARLVGKQFGKNLDATVAPYQFDPLRHHRC